MVMHSGCAYANCSDFDGMRCLYEGDQCKYRPEPEPCPSCEALSRELEELKNTDYCNLHKTINDGEGCPLCEALQRKADIMKKWSKEHKELVVVREEKEALSQRLAEAENRFLMIQVVAKNAEEFLRDEKFTLYEAYQSLMVGAVTNAELWLYPHQPGEYVAVRREDLKEIHDFYKREYRSAFRSEIEAFARLKAALEKEPK